MAKSPSPIQPLSLGNVVSAAIRLYGNHLKQYLGIAAIASLWLLVPYLVVLPFVFLGIGAAASSSRGGGGLFFLLAIVLGIGLFIYCGAKTSMNTGLISRLAYGELVEQPETTSAGRERLKPIMFRFLIAQVWVGLLLFAIGLGIALVRGIVTTGATAAFGRQSALTALILFIFAIADLIIRLWFQARWFIVEVPLAVEANVTSTETVGRSWNLTQGYTWRVLAIMAVAGLITLPVYAVAGAPLIFAFVSAATTAAQSGGRLGGNPFLFQQAATGLFGGFALSFLLFLVASVFVIPFWQTVKSIIYLDLRSRREGLGLQFRDRRS